MLRSLTSGATGLLAQQINLDITANNISNVNTPGFKNIRACFADLLYGELGDAGRPAMKSSQGGKLLHGSGACVCASYKDMRDGSLIETGNPLDVAIYGKGFFQVRLTNGDLAYTRSGKFSLNSERRLITDSGYELTDEIEMPDSAYESVNITEDGKVIAVGTEGGDTEVGQITLYVFENPNGLELRGNGLYVETQASGRPTNTNPGTGDAGKIKQSFIESSNVNLIEEMGQLIKAQRTYEANMRAVTTADELWAMANSIRK